MIPLVPAPEPDRRDPHLATALAAAAARIPPSRIAEAWIFPPRRVAAKESGLAVLVVNAAETGDARRTIWTLRYELEPGKGGKATRTDVLEEQGTVPPDRVPRIVEGVLRRLEGESDAPDVRAIGGEEEWAALLEELGAPAGGVDGINR